MRMSGCRCRDDASRRVVRAGGGQLRAVSRGIVVGVAVHTIADSRSGGEPSGGGRIIRGTLAWDLPGALVESGQDAGERGASA